MCGEKAGSTRLLSEHGKYSETLCALCKYIVHVSPKLAHRFRWEK
jgi:hypothetical protein